MKRSRLKVKKRNKKYTRITSHLEQTKSDLLQKLKLLPRLHRYNFEISKRDQQLAHIKATITEEIDDFSSNEAENLDYIKQRSQSEKVQIEPFIQGLDEEVKDCHESPSNKVKVAKYVSIIFLVFINLWKIVMA